MYHTIGGNNLLRDYSIIDLSLSVFISICSVRVIDGNNLITTDIYWSKWFIFPVLSCTHFFLILLPVHR